MGGPNSRGGDHDRRPIQLTQEEIDLLDRCSGTTDDPAALEEALIRTRRLLVETSLPDLPHIDAVREALPSTRQSFEAVMVNAFVQNAIVFDPDTENPVSVRDWLNSGRDPAHVILLAQSLGRLE